LIWINARQVERRRFCSEISRLRSEKFSLSASEVIRPQLRSGRTIDGEGRSPPARCSQIGVSASSAAIAAARQWRCADWSRLPASGLPLQCLTDGGGTFVEDRLKTWIFPGHW